MPKQHTFTLVPNPLGMQGLMSRPANGPQSKPPMTSKQAQKLYREANRGPRLSKAEQRQVERQEQDRIRRELDKAKQANKARVLREKKKAKEQQVNDEKKRKGLPLVKVRPSQDTISRFVRGNGLGRKRDSGGTKIDLPAIEEEAEDDRSTTEGGLDEDITPEDDATTKDCKRRRLDDGDSRGEDNRTEGAADLQRAEMSAKVIGSQGLIHPGEADEPNDLNVRHPPRPVKAFVKEVRHSEETQEQTDDSSRSPPAEAAPAIAEKTARDPKETLGHKSVGYGKTRVADKMKAEPTAGFQGKARLENAELKPTTVQEQTIVDPGITSLELAFNPPPLGLPANTAHTNSSEAIGGTLAKSATAKASTNPPLRQETPTRNISGGDRAMLTALKPQAKGPIVPQMLKRMPVNKQSQTSKPPPTKQFPAHPPSQHPRPAPKQLPAQHSSSRRILQETTNSSNRIPPVSSTSNASKFASPYKPTLSTPRRQATATIPTFKQSKPELPTGGAQKPKFMNPRANNAATHQRPSIPALAGNRTRRSAEDDFMSAPPTSTQLFVMSHIDDLFPSPSQEVRELQGIAPAVTVEQLPASRTKQFTRQVAHANASMAPPPRPTVVKPAAEKASEIPDMPFISTQDLIFSSQDLRELEEPTPRGKKGMSGIKPPTFRKNPPTIQRQPSPSSYSPRTLIQRTVPPSRTTHHFIATKPYPGSSQLAMPPQKEPEQERCAVKQSSAMRRSQTQNRSLAPPPCRGDLAGKAKSPDVAPRAPSPERPQFFGSCGLGVDVLFAMDRSRKTHEEEERRRRAQCDGRQGQVGNHPAGAGQTQSKHEENVKTKGLEINKSSEPREEQARPVCAQQDPPEEAEVAASQETDYGDLELDSIDFGDLGFI